MYDQWRKGGLLQLMNKNYVIKLEKKVKLIPSQKSVFGTIRTKVLENSSRRNNENIVLCDESNLIAENRSAISNKSQEKNRDSLLNEGHIDAL